MIDELKVIRFFPLHLDTGITADDGSQMPTKADIIGRPPKICKALPTSTTQWHRKIQMPMLCQESRQ